MGSKLAAHCHRNLGELYVRLGQCDDACTELSAATTLYRSMDMHFWLPQTGAALAQAMAQRVYMAPEHVARSSLAQPSDSRTIAAPNVMARSF